MRTRFDIFMSLVLFLAVCHSEQTIVEKELDVQEAVFRQMMSETGIDKWHPMMRKLQTKFRMKPNCWLHLSTPDPSGKFAQRFSDLHVDITIREQDVYRPGSPQEWGNGLIITSISWTNATEAKVRTDNRFRFREQEYKVSRDGVKWVVASSGWGVDYDPAPVTR